ncbi:MAG TPA: S24 family peptidase, partial [Elusimicrobiota bacterium]|nr:S24 family peptidase [Elusimicrobiota bacterium]
MLDRRATLGEYWPVAELLIQQGFLRYRVVSDSMAPAICTGDYVELESVAAESLVPGDTVVVAAQGAVLCHRLEKAYRQDGSLWLVTRGDAEANSDEPVEARRLIGRVKAVTRGRAWDRLKLRATRQIERHP